MTSLPHPLSDHTPISWSTQAGPNRPTYFKMDRSWLRDEGFKSDIVKWWHSHPNFGSASDRLITKLKDLRYHLFNLRTQIRTTRTQNRDSPSTHLDARCIGRAEISHDRRGQGAEDIPRRGGRGGSPNRDGLASAISGALAVSRRLQHALLSPDGEWATPSQWHSPSSDWRSCTQ